MEYELVPSVANVNLVIDDLVDFLVSVCGKANNQIYNIGSGNSYSVGDIVATCQKVWGTDLKLNSADLARKNEIPETRCNCEKAKQDFKWKPHFSLEQGIAAIKVRLENSSF